MRRVAWLLLATALLGGCATEMSSERSNLVDLGFMVLEVAPTTAQVFIDGRLAGRASDFVGQVIYLKDGPHTVDIVAPGFRTFSYRFYIDSSFPAIVRAALRQDPPMARRGS